MGRFLGQVGTTVVFFCIHEAEDPATNFVVIMKDGKIYKDTISR
jgi:hypothetical protein